MLIDYVAHIHASETTSNALDDAFRHCITQLSQLDCVAKKYIIIESFNLVKIHQMFI